MEPSPLHRNPGTKLIAVAAVGLVLGIPIMLVGILEWEREQRAREVTRELARSSGGRQTFHGPILEVPLLVPAVQKETHVDGRVVERTSIQRRTLLVSPAQVSMRIQQSGHVLRRAIFEVPAHTSRFDLTAEMGQISTADLPDGAELKWTEARWLMGVSDLRGIARIEIRRTEDGDAVPFSAQASEIYGWANLSAPAALTGAPDEGLGLHGTVELSGMESLSFTPSGQRTEVRVFSDWPHPSFQGDHLPQSRTISKSGFEAVWTISSFARGLPASAIDQLYLPGHEVGVRLVRPTDSYAQVRRSLKYAMPFLALVLVAFFSLELSSGVRVHPAQYGLVGLAQVTFYLLLLALSEHLAIDRAYLSAGAATTAVTGLYALWTFGERRFFALVCAGTGTAYAFQYALIQLEDHALLLGSLLAFAVVTGLMYGTRRVRWYRAA